MAQKKVKSAEAFESLKKELPTMITCSYDVQMGHCGGVTFDVSINPSDANYARQALRQALPLMYQGYQLVVIRDHVLEGGWCDLDDLI